MFHVDHYGETPVWAYRPNSGENVPRDTIRRNTFRQGATIPTEFEEGMLVGLLIGEGHFGGDGRQPQVTLRMHVRHLAMFRWLERTFPGGRLYGPYNHDGRHYYQWMARGTYLRDELLPLLDRWLSPELDGHSYDRLEQMRARYPRRLRRDIDVGGETPPVDEVAIDVTLPADALELRTTAIFDELRRDELS